MVRSISCVGLLEMADSALKAGKAVCDEAAKPGRWAGGYMARDRLKELGKRQKAVGKGEREYARGYADYGKEQQNPRAVKLASKMEKLADRRVKHGKELSRLGKDDDKKWGVRRRGFFTAGQCVETEVRKADEMKKDFDRLRDMKDELENGFGRAQPPPSYEKAHATAEKQSYRPDPAESTTNPPPYRPSRSRYEKARKAAAPAEHVSHASYGYDPRATATEHSYGYPTKQRSYPGPGGYDPMAAAAEHDDDYDDDDGYDQRETAAENPFCYVDDDAYGGDDVDDDDGYDALVVAMHMHMLHSVLSSG